MARKRSLPAALMALPQALKEALLRTIPEETIDSLDPHKAVAIGVELERTSRAIAEILAPSPLVPLRLSPGPAGEVIVRGGPAGRTDNGL